MSQPDTSHPLPQHAPASGSLSAHVQTSASASASASAAARKKQREAQGRQHQQQQDRHQQQDHDISRESSATSSPNSLHSLRSTGSHGSGLGSSNPIVDAGPVTFDNLPPPAYSATYSMGAGPTVIREADLETARHSQYGSVDQSYSYSNQYQHHRQQSSSSSQYHRMESSVQSPATATEHDPRLQLDDRTSQWESEPLLPTSSTGRRKRACCSGRGQKRRRQLRDRCCCSVRCTVRWFLLVCLILIVLSALLARLLSMDGLDEDHGDLGIPDPFLDFKPGPGCNYPTYFENNTFIFHEPEHFTFREIMNHHGLPLRPRFRVSGKVSVQRRSFEHDAAVIVLVSIGADELRTLQWVHYSHTRSILEIDTSDIAELSVTDRQADKKQRKNTVGGIDHTDRFGNAPCVAINVIVAVKPGVKLDKILLETVNLDIELAKGLDMEVRDEARIGSVTGSISNHNPESSFRSRTTIVEAVSGPIFGEWDLEDVLDMSAVAGNINVFVTPKEVSKEAPAPAKFRADTEAGSIHVNFPPNGTIPERDYRTDVTSVAGSIRGSYIHGSSTSFSSVASSVQVDLLPFAADEYPSKIKTESISGSLDMVVLDPYRSGNGTSDGALIARLETSHEVKHGSTKLRLPAAWSGTLEASSKYGSVGLHGEGLQFERRSHNFARAAKGKGDSCTTASSLSGSVHIVVGEDEV